MHTYVNKSFNNNLAWDFHVLLSRIWSYKAGFPDDILPS